MKPFTKNAPWQTNKKAIEQLPIKQTKLFACDVVRFVLPIFEQCFPKDNRPRIAIETAELFLYGKVARKQLQNAANAVWAAWAATSAEDPARAINSVRAINSAAWAAWAAWAINTVNANTARASVAAYAANAAEFVTNATNIHNTIHTIFLQTKQTPIPITPTLKAIATNIVQTRNFEEYYVLLDNLEEFHNIQLERTIPLGLSHYVLYTLTNTN